VIDMKREPLPEPSELTEGFWQAAREHRLVIQRCDDCRRLRHYPQPMCPDCQSARWAWSPVSGRGVIHSYSVTHHAFNPAWVQRLPYVVATIELDEGVRLVSDLPDTDLEAVAIGQPVEVFFDQIDDHLTLPRFRLLV
jgi:uncharacterized OB-fold protein